MKPIIEQRFWQQNYPSTCWSWPALVMLPETPLFKSYGRKCALARKDFFVARCHFLAALYLNLSRPCATCRITETRESVQNFAPSPNSPKKSRVLATYWAARRRAKPTAVQGPHSRRRQKKLTAPRRRQQNPSGEVLEFWAVEDEQDFAAHAHYVLYPKVELPLWPMASFVWSRNEPS